MRECALSKLSKLWRKRLASQQIFAISCKAHSLAGDTVPSTEPIYLPMSMSDLPTQANLEARAARLLALLETDPGNLNLLADAAATAFDARRLNDCDALLARYEAIQPLPPTLRNMRGLSAMSQGRFEDALRAFESDAQALDEPVLRYNRAYAHAMLGAYTIALALLNDDVIAQVPQAVGLRMRLLHHLGDLDAAIELGRRHANDATADVHGWLATALFDAGDIDTAREYAQRAVDTPEGLFIIGLLALQDSDSGTAMQAGQRALAMNPASGRAKLTLGLALLAQEQLQPGAACLDEAAGLLKSHAGTWVAAGWAYLLAGQLQTARARFETSMQLDRNFSEGIGGLAVVNMLAGQMDEADRLAEAALRLDRNCLSAVLVKERRLNEAGQSAQAARMREVVMHRPIGPNGQTIAQALAKRTRR